MLFSITHIFGQSNFLIDITEASQIIDISHVLCIKFFFLIQSIWTQLVNVENKNPFHEIFQSQFKMKLEPEL